MTCDEARELLHAFVDGELDLVHHARVDGHLSECDPCAELLERVEGVRDVVAGSNLAFEPPAHLEAGIRRTLRRADRARAAWLPPAWRRGLSLAVALAAGLVVGILLRGSVREDPIAGEVVANHVRSLMANHLVDVDSTDQHTVKPWFEGKLVYAPRVRDFAGAGFPLVGGRLDYLGGRQVAAVVYKRRQHVINLFVWPAENELVVPVAKTATRDGYTVFQWSDTGTRYALVSDVAPPDLEQLVGLLKER
jgi:anti-sigma factor RsiW